MVNITKEEAIANGEYIHKGFIEGLQSRCYLYHNINNNQSTGQWSDSNFAHAEGVLMERDFSEFNSKQFTVTAYSFYSPCVDCGPKLNDLLDKYDNMTLEYKFSFIYGNYDLIHKDIYDDNLRRTLREDHRFKLSVITPEELQGIKNLLGMQIEFSKKSIIKHCCCTNECSII